MDRDESLINGPGVQPPASVNVPVPRDVTGDVLRRGVAQVGQNIDGMCREMVETEDSTKQFEQERILMQTQDEVGSEARRRLQLPDGDPDAFFDERGNFSKKALNNFASPYLKRLQGIGSGILNPDLARKMRFKAAVAGDKMLNDLFDSGKEVARKKQETALNSSLKLAEETNNWGWYGDTVREAVKSGAIDQAQGQLLIIQGRQKELFQEAQRLMREDPSELALQMDEGQWNELNEKNLFKVQDELEHMLRNKAEQQPYTDSELKAIQEGRTVPPKYADLPGDTEKMRVWRQAKREGKLYLYKDDIEAEFRKEIANGPVFDSLAKYETWKKEMVKDWSDEKTGFGLTPDEVELACDHHIANMMSAGSGNSFNAAKLFDDLGYQQVVPLFYEKWRKKADDWYLTSNRRTLAEGAAVSEMEAAMERVKSNALKAYLSWERDHENKSRDEKFMKASELLAMFANNEKTSFDNKTFEANRIKKEAIYGAVYGNIDKYSNDSGKAALDEQKRIHQEYRKERAESAKKAARQRTVDQAKFMPVEVDGVINVSEREPGIYLDRKTFEQVVKAHGDAPVVLATIPERGSRRAAAKLPVLGWHEGVGTMLTSGARVRLLGRIRNVHSLHLKFLQNPESKTLEDSKMKEFTEKKKRKLRDADVPPDDFGIIPDNEVETAQPVSGAYLNGELTMLPPL
ncbi:hypothetical protein [Akkermansia sp.]|jgi:hypothetical protein|uniref:hypothetical protein n=1 Tax=Akkermansia sp. TaxID=1872421 RepID=UPI00258600A7|nr:hypothetical protein [Akkermansia sp.]MCD8320006.1 hypothetical protein [Akkermansia sp.]